MEPFCSCCHDDADAETLRGVADDTGAVLAHLHRTAIVLPTVMGDARPDAREAVMAAVGTATQSAHDAAVRASPRVVCPGCAAIAEARAANLAAIQAAKPAG